MSNSSKKSSHFPAVKWCIGILCADGKVQENEKNMPKALIILQGQDNQEMPG